jgi:hypothetical protein
VLLLYQPKRENSRQGLKPKAKLESMYNLLRVSVFTSWSLSLIKWMSQQWLGKRKDTMRLSLLYDLSWHNLAMIPTQIALLFQSLVSKVKTLTR